MATSAATTLPPPPQPLTYRILTSPFLLLGMGVGALFSAVVIEWFGMVLGFWSLSGSEHARQTLIDDIHYLNADFTRTVLGMSPVELASWSSQSVAYWLAYLVQRFNLQGLYYDAISFVADFKDAGRALDSAAIEGAAVSDAARLALQTFATYVDAAIYSSQTVIVRIVVAILTLPAYLLIGLGALLDGIVARDVRKFTGANESAFAYHRYRPWAKRFFVLGWYFYIAWPGPIHPNVIFVPSALMCGWAIFNTSKWFKKFF